MPDHIVREVWNRAVEKSPDDARTVSVDVHKVTVLVITTPEARRTGRVIGLPQEMTIRQLCEQKSVLVGECPSSGFLAAGLLMMALSKARFVPGVLGS